MQTKPHLLIVDDDRRIRHLLEAYLRGQGFYVSSVPLAKQALEALDLIAFDLIILDAMMPGLSGFDFLDLLRNHVNPSWRKLPVIMLTARNALDDRLQGLGQGADDYVSKPFDPRELFLRIQSILKRTPIAAHNADVVALGACAFDLYTDQLWYGTEPILLTSGELTLLKILLEKRNQTVTRELLAQRCGMSANPRAVDVQVARLRRKIELDPHHPQVLQTIRHQGYILRC